MKQNSALPSGIFQVPDRRDLTYQNQVTGGFPHKRRVAQAVTQAYLVLYSLSSISSNRQISWSLETARLDVILIASALKFDTHLDSAAVNVPVNFQSYLKCVNSNLAASRLSDILR